MADSNLTFDLLARDRASATFKKVGRNVDDTGKKFTGLSSRLGLFSRVGPRALTIFSTGLAAVGIGAAVMGTKTTASLEQADIAFSTLLGSGKKAQAFLGDLKQFAARTPFELPGLIDASRQLIGVGENAKDVIPTLRAWGDASGALGLGQEQFNRAMLAVTQSMSKGKVQAEELMQITEAGIPIWPLLSKALHKPVPELQKLSSQGKLLAKDVFPALEKQMEKDYGGAMAKQSQTLTGIWSTLMDTINLGLADTLKPLLPFMKTALSGAIDALNGVFSKLPGVINAVAPIVGGFIKFLTKTALPAVIDFGKMLAENLFPIDAIKAGFDKAVNFLAGLLPDIKQSVKPIHVGRLIEYDAPAKLVGLDKIKASFRLLQTFISDFFTGLRGGGNTKISVGRLLEIVPPKSEATQMGQRIRDLFSTGIAAGLAALDWNKIGRTLADVLITAIKAISRNANQLSGALLDVLSNINWFKLGQEFGRNAFGFAVGFVSTLFDGVIKAFKEHPLDTILQLVLIMPIGRLAGLMAKAVRAIPILRIFAPLLEGVARIGGLVERFLVKPVLIVLRRFFGAMSRGFLSGFAEVFPGITSRFGKWLSLLPTRIGVAAIEIREKVAAMMRGMGNRILDFSGFIGRVIGRVIGWITKRFENAGRWLISAGRRVLQGLWDGLKQKWEDVKNWFLAIPNWIKEHKGPISFDRKLLVGAGAAIMGGFLRGLRSGGAEALGYVKSIAGDIAGFLGGGVTGTRTFARGTVQLGQQLASQLYGWTGAQWRALYDLWNNESGWNPRADNPTSTAFGIPQFLASTARAYGLAPGDTNPLHQIVAGLKYIKDAYGSPGIAWAAWQSRSPHWYEKGTPYVPETGLAMLHKGEAVIPAQYNRRGAGGGVVINGDIHLHGVQNVNQLMQEITKRSKKGPGWRVKVVPIS